MAALGLAIVLATVIIVRFSRPGYKHTPKTQERSYVLFEADSVGHKPAIGYVLTIAYDTSKTVNNAVVQYRDTIRYVLWSINVTDSAGHVYKTRDDKDSAYMGWVPLMHHAFIQDLGMPKGGNP